VAYHDFPWRSQDMAKSLDSIEEGARANQYISLWENVENLAFKLNTVEWWMPVIGDTPRTSGISEHDLAQPPVACAYARTHTMPPALPSKLSNPHIINHKDFSLDNFKQGLCT
jgi:hypothetical protein